MSNVTHPRRRLVLPEPTRWLTMSAAQSLKSECGVYLGLPALRHAILPAPAPSDKIRGRRLHVATPASPGGCHRSRLRPFPKVSPFVRPHQRALCLAHQLSSMPDGPGPCGQAPRQNR